MQPCVEEIVVAVVDSDCRHRGEEMGNGSEGISSTPMSMKVKIRRNSKYRGWRRRARTK
jgi:hypothetical protein